MASSRTLRSAGSAPAPKGDGVHETITYPKNQDRSEFDPCLQPCSREHALSCGHNIFTMEPVEQCAPNCHRVENGASGSEGQGPDGVSEKQFYCDACVESEFEALIPDGATSVEADDMRTELRQKETAARGKMTKYRKCYISMKVSTVRCTSKGNPVRGYVPRKNHHPFDTALPQIGDNMFEDMDVHLGESRQPEVTGPPTRAGAGAALPMILISSPGDRNERSFGLESRIIGKGPVIKNEGDEPENVVAPPPAVAKPAKRKRRAAEDEGDNIPVAKRTRAALKAQQPTLRRSSRLNKK